MDQAIRLPGSCLARRHSALEQHTRSPSTFIDVPSSFPTLVVVILTDGNQRTKTLPLGIEAQNYLKLMLIYQLDPRSAVAFLRRYHHDRPELSCKVLVMLPPAPAVVVARAVEERHQNSITVPPFIKSSEHNSMIMLRYESKAREHDVISNANRRSRPVITPSSLSENRRKLHRVHRNE